jgi:peptidylprolyl isomerase
MSHRLAAALLVLSLALTACGTRDNSGYRATLTPVQARPTLPAGVPANTSLSQFTDGNAPGIPQLPTSIVTNPTGLRFIDEVVGDGPLPQTGQAVAVHYTGWLTDGKKFDSSVDRGQPFIFQIGTGQVIKGWDEGVATMQPGGKRRLIVPPELAYGPSGQGQIPANATLLFDVELLSIQQ